MSNVSTKPTLAFFGATGGCVNASLVLALKDGYGCSALARTPQKLHDMLVAKGVTNDALANLRIVKGDIVDVDTVKETIKAPVGESADIIISGIGMVFGRSPDTTVCQKSARTILSAIRELNSPKKSHLAVVSSTGVSSGPRDVPLAFVPLYRVLLAAPHADKRVMEQLVVEAAETEESIRGYTIIRPSLLTSSQAQGVRKIRAGDEQKPEVGYTISRNDVGLWIYEELIKGDASTWNGRKASLTY